MAAELKHIVKLIEALNELNTEQDFLEHEFNQFLASVCKEDPNLEVCIENQ